MQANNTHIQINPNTYILLEEFLATFETSKLLIIPLINHQNEPLDRKFASPSTVHNRFSFTLVGDRDLISSLKQPLPFFRENQNHTTYLFCCSSFRRSTVRFSPNELHLVAPLCPLPHSHPASNSNTHMPNKRKQHKDFNAIKHHCISIECSSLFPSHSK
jgi:hypothetical protein